MRDTQRMEIFQEESYERRKERCRDEDEKLRYKVKEMCIEKGDKMERRHKGTEKEKFIEELKEKWEKLKMDRQTKGKLKERTRIRKRK